MIRGPPRSTLTDTLLPDTTLFRALADRAVLAAQTVEAAPARVSEPGWSLGYRRAATLRSILELRADERFQTYRALAEKLGASRSFELARHVDGLRALRSERDDGIYIHMREHGRSADARASHLFTFARAEIGRAHF